MSNASSTPEPRVLLDGLAYVESPRWHDGRLWFAHWGTGQIVAVDLDGNSEVVGKGPPEINAAAPDHALGWSIDWLPDGRMLITGKELVRVEWDGSVVRHADLSGDRRAWLERAPGRRPRQRLRQFDPLRIHRRPAPHVRNHRAGHPRRHGPSGRGRPEFPNGMVVTPDNSTLIVSESFAGRLTAFDIAADGSLSNRRVWAEGLGPDGICMDAEGAIWVQTPDTPHGAVVRIREDRQVLERIDHDRSIFATALGGPDRTTLFLLANEWRGIEHLGEALAARTGQVLIARAPAPGAGWP